jgi:hypothetical protein
MYLTSCKILPDSQSYKYRHAPAQWPRMQIYLLQREEAPRGCEWPGLYKHARRSPKGPRLIAAAIRSAAGTYIQTNTHTHPKHIHKTFHNSTSIKPIRKPSSPLGSYNPGASQMATRKGPVSPRNSGLECRVIAERGGTTRLRVTFVGSNSIFKRRQ